MRLIRDIFSINHFSNIPLIENFVKCEVNISVRNCPIPRKIFLRFFLSVTVNRHIHISYFMNEIK